METDQYICLFKDILSKVNAMNNEMAALIILQEVSKDRRMEEMKKEKANDPATEKQIVFAKKLGLNLPNNTTKAEASVKIDEVLTQNGKHKKARDA